MRAASFAAPYAAAKNCDATPACRPEGLAAACHHQGHCQEGPQGTEKKREKVQRQSASRPARPAYRRTRRAASKLCTTGSARQGKGRQQCSQATTSPAGRASGPPHAAGISPQLPATCSSYTSPFELEILTFQAGFPAANMYGKALRCQQHCTAAALQSNCCVARNPGAHSTHPGVSPCSRSR